MAPIPNMMKAVQIAKNGGVEVLEYKDIPVPSLSEGQILVRNAYAGVNFIDTYYRSGLYPAPRFPLTLGREGAGEVISAHPSVAKHFALGTHVAYTVSNEASAYCEYTAIAAEKAVVVPDGVSTEVAAASLLQGLTAWCFIRGAANVQPGQWTLVYAAAGGVGSLLVQMLRVVGAKVIAVAGSEEKCALARKFGAEWTIQSHDDVVGKVKEITGGHGVDTIFDGVGKVTFDDDVEIVAPLGTIISFGNASGAVDPVNILRLAPKSIRLMRPTFNPYVATRQRLEEFTAELFDMIKSKKVQVAIYKAYPLADVAQAHMDLESRKTTGKLLLKL